MARGRKRKAVPMQVEEVEDQKQEEEEKQMEVVEGQNENHDEEEEKQMEVAEDQEQEEEEEEQMEEAEDQKQEEEEEDDDEEEEEEDDEEEEEEKEEEEEENEDEDEEEEEKEEEEEEEPPKKAERKSKRTRISKPESKKAGRKAKRARISKTEDEPEYFEDKRNLEDLWKEVFPVGTEWDQLDSVYQYNWSFKNLEDAFEEEEEGVLYGRRVYLFGCTETQSMSFKNEKKIIYIPVVVAVVSSFPPSDKVGINSFEKKTEEIVDMKRMKMDWVPYISLEKRESQVERLKSEIYILRCKQRRTALKHLKEDRVKKFECCVPYLYNPLHEEEAKQNTVVAMNFPVEPKPVSCEFDWELHEEEDFTDNLVKKKELPANQKQQFMKSLNDSVNELKTANKQASDARKKARDAIDNMRFYKFYPVASPDSPVVRKKFRYINRYYPEAHTIL